MTSAKCPLRLDIESRLRLWLLRVSGMPLNTLTYTQLRLITEGNIQQAKRLHVRGLDTLMHRPDTPPIPYGLGPLNGHSYPVGSAQAGPCQK
jgi:hypothetical protein